MGTVVLLGYVPLPEGFWEFLDFLPAEVTVIVEDNDTVVPPGRKWEKRKRAAIAYANTYTYEIVIGRKGLTEKVIYDLPSVLKHLESYLGPFFYLHLEPWEYTLLHEYAHLRDIEAHGIRRDKIGRPIHHRRTFRDTLVEVTKEYLQYKEHIHTPCRSRAYHSR